MKTMKEIFEENPYAAIAFSGGVDSSYLLYEAKKYAKRTGAYYVKTVFQPEFELEDAKKLASELRIELKIIYADILSDKKIAENSKKRCYFCKKKMLTAILAEAKKDGYSVLFDGTNASDEVSDRPGMTALNELRILSPLRICGLTKEEIRRRSKEAGLFTWNKPAYACLATRILTDQRIEERMLRRTEMAEAYLSSLGFSSFRVRTVGECAKIQVPENQIFRILEYREKIIDRFLMEYGSVVLDLEVRNEQ